MMNLIHYSSQRERALALVARLAEIDPVITELSDLVAHAQGTHPSNDGTIEDRLWKVLVLTTSALNEARTYLTGSEAQRLELLLAAAVHGKHAG